jgi:acyl carrier protein
MEIKKKITAIFRDVFDDPTLLVQDSTHSKDIDDWDSLNHINLIVAIEKEFKIKFALGELESLKNVGEMIRLIQKKNGA